MELRFRIEADGSLTVSSEKEVFLKNVYPGIDGHSVRALRVRREEAGIIWETAEGSIVCHVDKQDENCFELQFSLVDYLRPIHTFQFFYQADTDAEGFYQAAEGMGHDTGYYGRKSLLEKERLTGFGLCALQFSGCALTIYPTSQKHYETICEMEGCRLERYTDGSRRNSQETVLHLSCGARMENVNRKNVDFAPLKFLMTESLEAGLEKAAEEIGRNMSARLFMPPAYHWCSWYYCYQNFDQLQLTEYLNGLAGMEKRPDIKYFQLDVGYCTSIGDWLEPSERFPKGLKAAFDEIRAAGFVPGIWVGAFMAGNRSRLYREHPDWILYDTEDKPVRPWITDNEPKPWGYQDEEYYCLDTSHPEAMAYMKNVFETLHSWGAEMFKTDFMLWGLQDSSRVKRHTPGKTSVEYFREYLQVIREAIGEESYWLGCIAPFLPFVGYADGMRIGGDVGSSWDGEFGPQNMMRCLVGNHFTNHHYYQTDPDAVMLRDFQIRLTEREIHSLALLAAISGSCIYTSDPLHRIAEERAALFRFIEPDKRRKPSLPFLAEERPEIVMVHKEGAKGLLFILNKTEDYLRETYSPEELDFDPSWNIFSFQTGEREVLWKKQLVVSIPPHGCRLFLLSADKQVTLDYERLWNNLKADI
ncbi:glycoside hydrolase family 36 protein [Eisenbergiella porci]|uniref:glycoside hydrolase family 36 protein n=1 Tax=Eisenbergiella porci TaxID=2652274 RepID=UPI002A840E2B|nr:glycoside hydrolase family 36 protein [Eisenbergiella porci]